MRLNERCTALLGVLVLLLLLDSSWAQKPRSDKPSKKQKPVSDPHYRYKQHNDDYYGYGGYGQQHGGYGQPYSGGYKQPYKQDPYKQDYYKGSYKQKDYKKDYYGYDSYGSYDGYGKKHKYKKEKDEPTLHTTVDFIIDKCSLRYPGIGKNTIPEATSLTNLSQDLADWLSRPSTVVGWWSMHCRPSKHKKKKHGYDYGYDKDYGYADYDSSGSYNETDSDSGDSGSYGGYGGYGHHDVIKHVGECWYKGITDFGIQYNKDQSQPTAPMGTFITFLCKLKPAAQYCDPGLEAVNGDKVYFGGHGRVGITYKNGTDGGFNIENNVRPDDLLITGFYNGVADEDNGDLPLTRYNTGLVTDLTFTKCDNFNEPGVDGGRTAYDLDANVSDDGGGTFTVVLTI